MKRLRKLVKAMPLKKERSKKSLNYVNREPVDPVGNEEPNIIVSKTSNGMHMPTLDIDQECFLVESQTTGHYHLYINVACSWKQYANLLLALMDCGIIEEGYYDASLKYGMTALRIPEDTELLEKL